MAEPASPPRPERGAWAMGSTIAGEMIVCAGVGFWLYRRHQQVAWFFGGLGLGLFLSAYEFWKLIRASSADEKLPKGPPPSR